MAEENTVMLTSHKGGKVRNYTVAFKLEVVEYAENQNSNKAAALKFHVDRHCP